MCREAVQDTNGFHEVQLTAVDQMTVHAVCYETALLSRFMRQVATCSSRLIPMKSGGHS